MNKATKDLLLSGLMIGVGFIGGYMAYSYFTGKDPIKEITPSRPLPTPTPTPTAEEIGEAVATEIIE
jgi:hypothetical protein